MGHQQLPNFDKLWDYNNPEATAQQFQDLLPVAESAGDEDYHAQLLTQLARTYSLRSMFGEAHDILDVVEKMLASRPTLRIAHVRYLLERGRAYNSAGERARAKELFEQAFRLAVQVAEQDPSATNAMRYAIDAVHMIAIAAEDPVQQIEWNRKGIDLALQHESQRGWLWALYNNIGESYLLIKDYENAYRSFTNLAEYQIEKIGEADQYTLKDQAKALRLWGKPAEALTILEPLRKRLQSKEEKNGWVEEELAESLLALGDPAKAQGHFIEAYELLSQDKYCLEFEPGKLKRLKEMAGR